MRARLITVAFTLIGLSATAQASRNDYSDGHAGLTAFAGWDVDNVL